MDSLNIKNTEKTPETRDVGWDVAQSTPLPSAHGTSSAHSPKKHLSPDDSQLAKQLSQALKKNSFMESQIQFLEKKSRQMEEKTIFLQDQYLILKETQAKNAQSPSHLTKQANFTEKTNLTKQVNLTKQSNFTEQANLTEEKKPEIKPTSKSTMLLFTAGQTINKQRQVLQQMTQLIESIRHYHWKFFKRQQQRQRQIQNLNGGLRYYLSQIHQKGSVFQKQHQMILHKACQIFKKQIETMKSQYEQNLTHLQAQKDLEISETQKKANHRVQEVEKQTEDLLNQKTNQIAELNQEIKQLHREHLAKERLNQDNSSKQLKTQHLQLSEEHTKTLEKIKTHYEDKILCIQQDREKERKNLKERYNQKMDEKSKKLDERIITLKEEQDNQMHYLREEMEQELLAEKRKSIQMEKAYHTDIEKLQKDFNHLQSEMELNKFKTTFSKSKEQELLALRELNQNLQKKNYQLRSLWRQQTPEIENQKQQIISLQKLNQELSQLLQSHSAQKKEPITKTTNRSMPHNSIKKIDPNQAIDSHTAPEDLNTFLHDIYVHKEF